MTSKVFERNQCYKKGTSGTAAEESTMVSADNREGLYLTVPLYFIFLARCAWWAHDRANMLRNDGAHEGVKGAMSVHYLGARDFGPVILSGTFFASLFSGYTVVGVPNDAFRNGFFIIWWIPSLMSAVAGCFGTGIRLRKFANVRDHQSPVDFITDRFQSQMLRYTITFLQVVPGLIYLSAQVIAIKGTFNSIFEIDADSPYPVIIIMFAILSFEWVGGLSSVALTDAIQAVVMILSFIIIPSVIKKNFGGWPQVDLETYPKPEFYQTFSKEEQWNFWQLSVINFSFFTLPHFIQRNYAARNLSALKAGYAVMACGPWFTTFVGVFMGTIGVKILGEGANPSNPFTAILEEVMNLGGFPEAAGVVAVTCSLAAIMSTADSLIIAVSQLVTMEVICPNLPNITPRRVVLYARLVSLVAVIVSLFIGLVWDEGITDLGKIQFPLSTQAVPAFLFGLYIKDRKMDIHPWSIVAGAAASTIYVIAFYFGYQNVVDSPLPVNAGISGFALNLTTIVSVEVGRRMMKETDGQGSESASEDIEDETRLLFPERPEWDVPDLSRFGKVTLSPERVWKHMEGVEDPLASWVWVILFFLVVSLVTPLVPENEPPLIDGAFAYAPRLIAGMPWWFFKILMISLVSTIILLVAIFRMPSEYPENDLDEWEVPEPAQKSQSQRSNSDREQPVSS